MLVQPTSLGSIASFYYITHKTVRLFCDQLTPDISIQDMFWIICCADEFTNLPVRHNEDKHNENMIPQLIWHIDKSLAPSPYGKTSILFQARFEKLPFPVSDYATDLKLVLDQSSRLLLGLIDICADAGWLQATLNAINIQQSVIQGRWLWDSPFINLPLGSTERLITSFNELRIETLSQLIEFQPEILINILSQEISKEQKARNSANDSKQSSKKQKSDQQISVPSMNQIYKNVSGNPLSKSKIDQLIQCICYLPRVHFVVHGVLACKNNDDATFEDQENVPNIYEEKARLFTTTPINRSRLGITTLNPSHLDFDDKFVRSDIVTPVFRVNPGSVISLSFGTCRLNGWKSGHLKGLLTEDPLRVLGPTDVKSFKESWWILVGNQETDEVLALSKININVMPRNTSIQILVPDTPSKTLLCTAYLMSDSYIGLDQQYDFILDIASGDNRFIGAYEF